VNTNRPCTSDVLVRDLADLGIDSYFDAFVCSRDAGFFKPHPASFERSLELLGVDARDTVMVGDWEQADIKGAKALGMQTVWKLNGRYGLDPSPDADYTIHDLGELLGLPMFEGIEHVHAGDSTTPHEDGNADRY
jgi:FMN phosphatase YigB (HAD superfamily)